MKILIAEDDLVSRTFLCKFLERYGDCDLVLDGLEALDAFLLALRERDPYRLICLDIMMPNADGVKTLQAIRDLEGQFGIAPEARARIIMTTALAEAQLVQAAFDCGCEAYATKPIDTQALLAVLKKLGLIGEDGQEETAGYDKKDGLTTKQGMRGANLFSAPASGGDGYFKSVQALPAYRLRVRMGTGTDIEFDFRPRLGAARFGRLADEEFFQSVRTDGSYLIFEKAGKMPVRITASEFMDLVLVDRGKQGV